MLRGSPGVTSCFNGSAPPPGGRPTDRVTVSLRVGGLRKSFDVVGNRVWQAGRPSLGPSAAARSPDCRLLRPGFGGIDKARANRTRTAGTRRTRGGRLARLPRYQVPRRQAAPEYRRRPVIRYASRTGRIGRWRSGRSDGPGRRGRSGGGPTTRVARRGLPVPSRDFDDRLLSGRPRTTSRSDYLRGGGDRTRELDPAGRTAFGFPRRHAGRCLCQRGLGRTLRRSWTPSSSNRMPAAFRSPGGPAPLRRNVFEVQQIIDRANVAGLVPGPGAGKRFGLARDEGRHVLGGPRNDPGLRPRRRE